MLTSIRKNLVVRKSKSCGIIIKDFKLNKYVYLMLIPVIAFYIIFSYWPMYGTIIAFKNFKPSLGILGSQWVGFTHFQDFLGSFYFWRLVKNTLVISILGLIFSFPAPIIFALLLNEVKNKAFKSTIQTITYFPHFVSMVIICGLIIDFTGTNGVINDLIELVGGTRSNLLIRPDLFRAIYISTDIWQNIGWESIIYLAALSGINSELYEAAIMDGAGKWKQMINITIPGIMPTVSIMLILAVGNIMSIGWEKIILLYTPLTYETADVISSFVYRRGLIEFDYSYSSAIGLFNSVFNFILLILANKVSRKINESSLW